MLPCCASRAASQGRVSFRVLIGISKLALSSLIEALYLVLDRRLSTKIDPKSEIDAQKYENVRIDVFTPLSLLGFKGLAQYSLLKPLHT